MDRFRIGLVDDSRAFLQEAGAFLESCLAAEKKTAVIDLYEKPAELLWKLEEGLRYDLLILDLKMPAMSGMELAGRIRKRDAWSRIQFLTDYEDGAVASYQVEACGYVMKNRYHSELPRLLFKCYQSWEQEKSEYYVYHYDEKYRVVSCREIRYVRSDARTRMITIVMDNEELRERKSLVKFLEEIHSDSFLIVSKGTAVNLLHVIGAEDGMVILRNGARLPLSETYKPVFFRKMAEVIGTGTFGRM